LNNLVKMKRSHLIGLLLPLLAGCQPSFVPDPDFAWVHGGPATLMAPDSVGDWTTYQDSSQSLSGAEGFAWAWTESTRRFAQSKDGATFDLIERLVYNAGREQVSTKSVAAATQADTLLINLYAADTLTFAWLGDSVVLAIEGAYPLSETVILTWLRVPDHPFSLWLRMPGWAAYNRPAPGGRYRYASASNRKLRLSLNGEWLWPPLIDGYARLRRSWQLGDRVELSFPMALRQVLDRQQPTRVALMLGPVIFSPLMSPAHPLTRTTRFQLREGLPLGGQDALCGFAVFDQDDQLMALPYACLLSSEPAPSVWLPYQTEGGNPAGKATP
jgi:hypothetical protein